MSNILLFVVESKEGGNADQETGFIGKYKNTRLVMRLM